MCRLPDTYGFYCAVSKLMSQLILNFFENVDYTRNSKDKQHSIAGVRQADSILIVFQRTDNTSVDTNTTEPQPAFDPLDPVVN